MKAKELREFSDKELEAKLRELRADLFNQRFHSKTGQMEKPSRIRLVKKNIARALTIENEKKRQSKEVK